MKKSSVFALIGFLGVFLPAALAFGDVAPKCKCEAAGAVPPGGLAMIMTVAGAGVLVALRSRKSPRS